MGAHTILIVILAIISFDFILDKILDYLNLRNLKEKLPGEVEGIYDEEKYKKSIQYTRANTKFSFLSSTFSFALSFALIASGFFGWLDAEIRTLYHDETLITMLFFALLFFASDIINLPFDLYGTFVIEEKFGFNKTTAKTYVLDKLKGYLLTLIIGGGILFIFLQLIDIFGANFWVYFWLVAATFMLLINMFYTTLILPLFNKLTPLEDGELKKGIEEYAQKVKFPLDNIFVMDGSKRSNKSNAFFSGIGKKKKIVLFDTLIQNHSKEELVAVLAHEVGHFKKKHIVSSYIISILQTGIILYILSLMIFNPSLSQALGGEANAIHLNLLAFGILFSPISEFIGLFMNILSRKNEYEADAYARETYKGEALENALKKLSVHNLSNLTPHPAYVFFHYSHPPLLQRLRALESSE